MSGAVWLTVTMIVLVVLTMLLVIVRVLAADAIVHLPRGVLTMPLPGLPDMSVVESDTPVVCCVVTLCCGFVVWMSPDKVAS